jgi:hypothetical protein
MTSTGTRKAFRRTTRVRTQIPIRIVSADPAVGLSEYCQTLVVNLTGCGVRLTHPLTTGLPIKLEQLPCGRSVPAHVMNCAPIGTQGRFWLVGIALDQPENVWCIQPVPEDWSEDYKPPAPAAPVAHENKSSQWPYSQFSSKGESHPGRK